MDLRLSLAVSFWLLLLAVAFFPILSRGDFTVTLWKRTVSIFLVLLSVALPVWRLRSLMYNGEINVDESMILAQAMKYLSDPMPWRSVVGGSSGPLNTWVLLWAPLLGLKLGYLAARITGILCIFALLFGTILGLSEIAGRRLALVAAMPATTLLLSTLNLDFLHFSSEQFPSALCAWIVYLIARQRKRTSRTRAYLLGFLTGALPFTKLQVAPAGVLLFVFGIIIIWATKDTTLSKNRNTLAQILGGLTVPALILLPVTAAGVWPDFMEFYIQSGLRYSNSGQRISALDFLFKSVPDFSAFFTVLIAASVGALLLQSVRRPTRFFSPSNLLQGAGLLSLFGVMLYGILRAGFGFPHYLMLLIGPSTLAAGWLASDLFNDQSLPSTLPLETQPSLGASVLTTPTPKAKKAAHTPKITSPPSFAPHTEASQNKRLGLGIVFLSVFLCLFQARSAFAIYSQNKQFLGSWGQETNPIADALKQMAKPGDSLCIWGWYAKLHVFTQLRPATRFAAGNLEVDLNPEANPTLRAFLSDVQTSKPAFFVDASDEFVFPGSSPGSQPRYHTFPEFSRWIQSEYTLIGSTQTHPSRRPVLIYKRR
jgi:hypothetical protein